MIAFLRQLLAKRARQSLRHAREAAAVRKAADHFAAATGIQPMGCVVLRESEDEVIVRVMHMAGRIPPERTWYSVRADGSIAELEFKHAVKIDTALWR